MARLQPVNQKVKQSQKLKKHLLAIFLIDELQQLFIYFK